MWPAVLAAVVLLAAATPVGAASWSRAARLSGTVSLDATPAQIAFASNGQAAVSFGFVNPDAPSGARASLALLSSSGRPIKVRSVPHTRQVLDLAYLSGTLQLLGGTSGGGLACCTEIQTLSLDARGFSQPRPLMRQLAGASAGRLLASGSGALAVFASDSGVWAARAGRDAKFGGVRRLSSSGAGPQSLAAAAQHGGGALVAFTQTLFHSSDAPIPATVMLSQGAGATLPPRARAAQTFAAGTVIGPLALAPNPFAPTLGWAQDSADSSGANRSQIVLAAVGATLRTRTYTVAGEIESGLSGAADSSGDELFAWDSCDTTPSCQVLAVSRAARGHFGSARPLGGIDAAAEPSVAVGAQGAAVIAWVQGGHIYFTRRSSGTQRFSTPARLTGPGPATGLTLAAGPGGRVLAVWAAGTTRTTVWASELR